MARRARAAQQARGAQQAAARIRRGGKRAIPARRVQPVTPKRAKGG